jgi:hypothetical protein
MLSHVGADPAQRAKSAGLVCDALEVLGVSLQELRVATTRGLMGQPSRWNQILTDEFMEQMTVKDKQP